ncbi:MAG: NapC/NirT family cytochrome c [candidate division Zixibacteria bacterium]|nr:NapC/NirT family cytochrome c [candidate division Zixibacteria bacterium]
MFVRFIRFARGVSVNWYSRLGVILATSSFVTLVVLELARILGIITSSLTGLVTYLLFPSLFIIGLILIPIGWYKLKKQTGKTTKQLLDEHFDRECLSTGLFGSKLFVTIGTLAVLNILFMSTISFRMLSFMDEPVFCGTACHSVMNPEWTTYQQSPHARVRCVDCHVGEGADALVDSKLNGIWQLISVTFNLLERPIPTPVHQLRPARETCEKCHWPEKFYGSKLKTITSYAQDETSLPLYTTLNLKIDAGKGDMKTGIHWHVSEETKVRYVSVNDEREKIISVEVARPDGSRHRYTNRELTHLNAGSSGTRTMDCVDCHNRVTHIYENPERAINERISLRLIDRSLPFLKREALHAISSSYASKQAGLEGIADHMHGFYQRHYPETARRRMAAIDSVVEVLQTIYERNVHPEMNITWGTYPSHIGHIDEHGCFRCHNSKLVDQNGSRLSYDCVLCHSILADRQAEPFKFLQPADSTDPNYERHKYLRDEFLNLFSD